MQALTIYVDNQELCVWTLKLAEQCTLGVQVGFNAPKLIHLVLQDVGEDNNIDIHLIKPVNTEQQDAALHRLSKGQISAFA